MSDVNGAGTGTTIPTFGVSNEIKSSNVIPFSGGFNKAILTSVVKELVGKETDKMLVLTFNFKDVEGNKSLRFSEFTIDPNNKRYAGGSAMNKAKTMSLYDEDILLLNMRIKHIYECYVGKENFPKEGLGIGATSWDDFFTKIAVAFNTNHNGKEIYLMDGKGILVHVKMIYDNKDNLRLPYRPNFIERIDATNQTTPKTLNIDKRYDKVEQGSGANAGAPGVMGGVEPTTGYVF